MAERGLGLGPVSFAPLPADGPPRARRSDVVSSGPLFQLVAGNLDRTLRTGSRWSTSASVALHVAVIAFFIAMIPAIGVIAMPDVPSHIVGFVAPMPSPPPPPPGQPPAAETAAGEPSEPSEPPPPVEDPIFAAPPRPLQGIMPETGLVASLPVTPGIGVAGGVGWGGYGGGNLGGLPTTSKPTAPAPEPPQEPIRIGGPIPAPAQTRRVEPIYPDIAVRAKLEGMVIIEAIVDTEGRPQSLNVLRSQGPLLDRAALDAVTQWRYEPLLYHGEAVPFVLTVTISFALQ